MTAVLLFAKAPRAGAVKTRLAAQMGEAAALAAYREIGAGVACRVGEAYALTVWYDPPDARDETRRWLGDHEYLPQIEGGLGERLKAAVAAHLGRGDRPVIAIGADVPGITAETIRRSEALLREADVVLGPAKDGGYYLIGMVREHPELFREISWGSSTVLAETASACERAGLTMRLLEPLVDVDSAEDLRASGLDRFLEGTAY
jgi:rSAM/selenodomain-associated transferase 1